MLSAPTAFPTVPSAEGAAREGAIAAMSIAPTTKEVRAEVEVAAEPEQSAATSVAPLVGVSLGLEYILRCRRTQLITLLSVWWKDIAALPLLPKAMHLNTWGPSHADIELALRPMGPMTEGMYSSQSSLIDLN